MSWFVGQDHIESSPESSHQRSQTDDESDQDREGNEISKRFRLKEARKCITLHGLEHIVFSIVEYFGIVSAFFLDCSDDPVEH